MTKLQPSHEQALMIEALIRRRDYFWLIIDSHRRWMREAQNEKVRAIHLALVRSLLGVAEQYDVLLNALQKPN